MTRTTAPPPITWDRDKLGTERAKLDEHGATATLAPVPGGVWWQVYWPPVSKKKLARAARQGNAGNREDAIAAAFAAFHAGRP